MKSKNNNSAWKSVLSSRLLLVFEIAIVLLFSFALVKEVVRRWEVRQEIKRLEDQIAELNTQNSELSGLIDYFQSDYYKEREARLKLGLQKEGESALSLPVISNVGGGNASETTAKISSNAGNESIPQKWWNYFFAK